MPVLVLGMHRSGTSVLTRVISLLGLEVGDDDLLMGADPSNESGHWEVIHLTDLNDELLRELGGRWSGPPRIEPERLAAMADGHWGDRARSALDRTFHTASWVWKDPRSCLLVPFWRRVVGEADLSVVLAVRDPLEVARSLHARNGIGERYGAALWERYQRSALGGARGLPALVVRYDDLLADAPAVARRLHRFLPASAAADPEAVAAAVDPSRRHHSASTPGELTREAEQLLAVLSALAGEHEVLDPELPPETPNVQLAFDEHARLAHQEDLVQQQRPLVEEAIERRAQVAGLEARLRSIEAMRSVRAARWVRRLPRRLRGS